MKYALIGCGRIARNHMIAAHTNSLEHQLGVPQFSPVLTLWRQCQTAQFKGLVSQNLHTHTPTLDTSSKPRLSPALLTNQRRSEVPTTTAGLIC